MEKEQLFSISQKIDPLFAEFDKPETPGCALGIISMSEAIYKRGYGIANLEYDIPITPDTVFHVCSMAKQFTGMCIALLEEQGRLRADDDIREYLSGLPEYGEGINVGNLIHMTNGLYDFYCLGNYILGIRENDFITEDEANVMIRACDWLMFKPGERWSYSNTGYFLLTQIIKQITGKSVSAFADDQIFKPLGMAHTFFRDDQSKIIKGRAESYSDYTHVHYNDREKRFCTQNDKYSINHECMDIPGAGQLWTNVEDLIKWDNNFYENKLGNGSSDLIKKVTTSGRLNNGDSCSYGYGLFTCKKNGTDYVWHGGWANGFSSMILRLPEKHFSVIILGNHTSIYPKIDVYKNSNSNGKADQIVNTFFDDISGSKFDNSMQVENAERSIASNVSHTEKVGKYQDPVTSWLWYIRAEGSELIVTQNYHKEIVLQHFNDDTFVSKDGSLTCRFDSSNSSIIINEGKAECCYMRFINNIEDIDEFTGEYICEKISTGFTISAENDRLFMKNKNRHNTSVDLYYSPTIKDNFITCAPPYINYYCISFQRDTMNKIISFTFRDDEGSGRENLVFRKC